MISAPPLSTASAISASVGNRPSYCVTSATSSKFRYKSLILVLMESLTLGCSAISRNTVVARNIFRFSTTIHAHNEIFMSLEIFMFQEPQKYLVDLVGKN